MVEYIVLGTIVLLLLLSLFINLSERKYRIDLGSETDASRLAKLGVTKLELKRYLKTVYFGGIGTRSVKRREIAMDSKVRARLNLINQQDDELEVTALRGDMSHTVYVCMYSAENRERLEKIVSAFNSACNKKIFSPEKPE